MVYKIQGDFTPDNMPVIIDYLCKKFKFIYKYNCLYISPLRIEDENQSIVTLDSILKSNGEFLKININEFNLKKEPNDVIEWCRDCSVEQDKQRYENDKQDRLKEMDYVLDLFETILKEEQEYREKKKKKRKEGLNGSK